MRFPLSWIHEYIPLNHTPDQIAKILTMQGIEVESYETEGLAFEGVIVGLVTDVQKHPDADKLCVATVSDGKNSFQVVCGAPNCRKGMKTAFAPIGAVLKEEDGKTFTIKKSKLRGVESFGMLCAGKELNLTQDDDGIMDLSQDVPEGTPLSSLYGDTIFEVGLTPNLGHCSSIIGIARELSAATGIPLQMPKTIVEESGESIEDAVRLTVLDPNACPRYTCRVIKNVQVGPSPDALRMRLEKCGLRPVNNIVDITNYVLLEMGHPLHAFDYDLLDGKQIVVKKAEEGEQFTTLDHKERALTSNDLMIADGGRSVTVAGIMGGLNSEVTDQTRNILIESAYFDPVTIRKTSKRFGLQTDSSKRFERGADPNGLIPSLDRATMLIQQIVGGQVCKGVAEAKTKEFAEKIIPCRLSRTNQILGLNLGRGEIESIFKRLQFHSFWEGSDKIVVQVPTYRVDLQIEEDLIEEVARLYGYDNIPRKNSYYCSSPLQDAPIFVFEKEVQERLIAEGLQEFLTCDLIGPSALNLVQNQSMQPESMVKVLNPTSIEQSILRTSLLPGLLQVINHNIDHQNHHIGGFEIGRIHFTEGNQFKEQSVAGIILSGKSREHHWDEKPKEYDFYDLKGIVENLLFELGITDPVFKNLQLSTFHSGRQASVFVGSLEIGTLGEIHPSIQRRLDVPQRILFGEFNLHDLIQVAKPKGKIKKLAIYPGSERDWTLTIKKEVPFTQIMQYIKQASPSLLEDVSILDIYCSDKLGNDYQNLTLRFVYRDPTKTVIQEVVDKEHQRLVLSVIDKLGNALKV